MTHDCARYVGSVEEYHDQVADIRPHMPTQHLPLEERKVFVRWHNPNLPRVNSKLGQHVGTYWHDMPAADFRILVRV